MRCPGLCGENETAGLDSVWDAGEETARTLLLGCFGPNGSIFRKERNLGMLALLPEGRGVDDTESFPVGRGANEEELELAVRIRKEDEREG